MNSDHKRFEKPKTAGRVSDYALTSELNLALGHIAQAMDEAVGLPDDAFSSAHCELAASQKIIKNVIEWMEYEGYGDDGGDGDDEDDGDDGDDGEH